jgi:rSAM/selenodomain-associated transferase 2
MNVSVVIPTVNESATISQAIQRAWLAGASQVVVSDGGSDDETRAIANQLDCQVVSSPRGRGVQLNVGAEGACGDVLLFLHADNWLVAGAIDQIRLAMRKPCVQCGAFRQRIESAGLAYRLLELGNGLRVRVGGIPFGDQGIFVRRQLFFEVGGFPRVPIMEDVLLMKRLRCRTRPVLLNGPIHVSPRRWQQNGVFRQTVRNWLLQAALSAGIPPNDLARFYPTQTTRQPDCYNAH